MFILYQRQYFTLTTGCHWSSLVTGKGTGNRYKQEIGNRCVHLKKLTASTWSCVLAVNVIIRSKWNKRGITWAQRFVFNETMFSFFNSETWTKLPQILEQLRILFIISIIRRFDWTARFPLRPDTEYEQKRLFVRLGKVTVVGNRRNHGYNIGPRLWPNHWSVSTGSRTVTGPAEKVLKLTGISRIGHIDLRWLAINRYGDVTCC